MLQGMFGWDDFREDGKNIMENMRENEWEGCLVEREGERKIVGSGCFLPRPTKTQSSENDKKIRVKVGLKILD